MPSPTTPAEAELDGVPDDVQQTALAAADAEGKDGYKLTLKMPCYLPVMQFAKSSALRETLYRAYVTRASDQAAGEAVKFDNSALIREILALRQEEAQAAGLPQFRRGLGGAQDGRVARSRSSPSCATWPQRPGPTPSATWPICAPSRHRTWALPDPQPWDWPYISEKLKEARYAFSEQEVKQYFTAPKVLAGLFKIIETLFEVSIRRRQRAGLAPGRALLPHRTRAGDSWSASSTWTRPRAPASAAAPGWTMCAPAGCAPTPAGCKPRWRTWCATSPTAWMASRRC